MLVSIKANKMYPYLKEKNIDRLLKEETKEIKKNVFAMVFHKVGGIVVNSTDNIIISKFVSLSAVGLYSNYYLITNALNIVIGQVFTSMVASIGNLGAKENKEKLKNIFNKVFFLNFWIFGFSAICLYILFNDFISLWLGAEYLLPESVMLVIVVSFCIEGMRKSVLDFRDALGVFWYDRYKPIFEVIINLIASIILVQKIGLAGVFVGTIISTLMTSFWVEPYVLYKYGFKMKLRDYFKQYLKYTIVTLLVAILTVFIINTLFTSVTILTFIGKLLLCIGIPNLCFILIFRKGEEFIYYKDLMEGIINKIKNIKNK